jgi:hypothetical protein
MGPLAVVLLCLGIGLFMAEPLHGVAVQQQSPPTEQPIWAKRSTALDLSCTAHPPAITAPDHQSSVEVICSLHKDDDPTYVLRVITADHHLFDLPLEEGAHELLWAPNSKSFFVNGGESAYSGFFVSVYEMDSSTGVRKRTLTGAAQRDMVKSFPPCKAWNRDDDECARITREPQYNMSGLGWTEDSSAVYVFAEVPCSSSYGGIMCQVLGYELNVRSGRILKRLPAQQVKQEWAQFAAWDIRVPDPPKYGAAHVTW